MELNNQLAQLQEETTSERQKRFKERFAYNEENGSYKLTADGCNKRYQMPRDEMYLTEWENTRRDFRVWNRADREESDIQNKLVRLIQRGFRFLDSESIEDFILRCQEIE